MAKMENCIHEKSPHHYNMTCLDCLARHVLMIFMPKYEQLSYMEKLSVKYGVDIEKLKARVTELHNLRKDEK